MSLNISPETKRGSILDWDHEERFKNPEKKWEVNTGKNKTVRMNGDEITEYLIENNYSLSSNGIMYSQKHKGILGSVLKEWFEERVQFKKRRDSFLSDGNAQQGDFYDRRQYVQKILLNSLYGVQALPILFLT